MSDTKNTAQGAGIEWGGYSREIFDRAAAEGKLILLDIGATWCHWCHVMDRVTYEDEQVAQLVQSRFIPVRIDRDRLPEIDARYQRAPPLLNPSGQAGGWPLTVVISPGGVVLYKAAYLPPRADIAVGAANGLVDVLQTLDRLWHEQRADLEQAGEKFRRRLGETGQVMAGQTGRLAPSLIETVLTGMKAQYDTANGGFGDAPKFYAPAALELLALRAWTGDREARQMLVHTLDAMARGGVQDQLGGGFARYSVDANWHVPHFEKMAYDNAALLAIYADAAVLTGLEEFAQVANRTLGWMNRRLLAEDRHGFYASQDADVGLDDDGDYFTWTIGQLREVLGIHDAELAISYWGVGPGRLHGRPGRNVLHVPHPVAAQAKLLDMSEFDLAERIERISRRLLTARQLRPEPKVDKTVFADLNGMCVDAYLRASAKLGREDAAGAAQAVLDRLLETLRDERGVFAHYRDEAGQLVGVGALADQAWMGRACLTAYCRTGQPKYFDAARAVADYILAGLMTDESALLSSPAAEGDGQPRADWQDSPIRSAASVAAGVLLELSCLSGQEQYATAARSALSSFAGSVNRHWATFIAGYALAVEQALSGPRRVVVVGDAALAREARRWYVPDAIVLELDGSGPERAEQLSRLGYAGQENAAYVCAGSVCLPPAHNVKELSERICDLAGLAKGT